MGPTNNAAERALRPAVISRKTNFGAHSQSGSQFGARLLTGTTSLKAPGRDILDVLTYEHGRGKSLLLCSHDSNARDSYEVKDLAALPEAIFSPIELTFNQITLIDKIYAVTSNSGTPVP